MKTRILAVEAASFTVEQNLTRLALEASVAENVYSIFRDLIPGLSAKLADIVSSLNFITGEATEAKEFKANAHNFTSQVRGLNYADYRKMLVEVPEGFEGNLLDYLKTLVKHAPIVYNDTNKLIGEYNFVLSSFITNKENKVSLQDHQELYLRVQERRELISKQLDAFFNPKSTLSRQPLFKVIDNFEQMTAIANEVYTLSKLTINLNEIKAAVDKTNSLLKIIVDQIKTDSFVKVGGAAATGISTGAYEIAKYVEFVSLFHFRAQTAVVSSYHLADQLRAKAA